MLILGIDDSGLAVAQTADSTFQMDVSYTFGQLLVFRLAGEDDRVETATLFFQAPEFDNTYVGEPETVAATAVGLQVSHEVDLSEVRLAPFTEVTYWWVLQTAAGTEIRTPEQQFTYADNQFEWQNLAQGNTIVYWTGDEAALGQIALDVVSAAKPQLQNFVAAPDDLPLSIYIYPTSADLRAALRLTGRDWVGAHVTPELGVILVTAVNVRTAATDLGQSLPHEMMHFYLYQAMKDDYAQLPVWLNEGVATLVELTPRPAYEAVLETAVANQTTILFEELCTDLPSGDEQILLAYAQSLSLVQTIQTKYGNQKLRDLLAAFEDGADCQSGVERTLAVTVGELNQSWLRSLQPRSGLTQFFLDNSLWLLLLLSGLGMTGLLIIKKPL